MNTSASPALLPAFVIVLLSLSFVFLYRTYLRVSLPAAFGFLLGAIGIGIFATRERLDLVGSALQRRDPIDRILVPICG